MTSLVVDGRVSYLPGNGRVRCVAVDESLTCWTGCHDSATFLRAAGANVRSKGQNLQSYAIMPVQRVPRYLLLLRELIKWTSSEHPDRANLELALSHVDESARHMNAAIQVRKHPSGTVRVGVCSWHACARD